MPSISDISNDTDSYSEEEDDEQPQSWYNGWDSDN